MEMFEARVYGWMTHSGSFVCFGQVITVHPWCCYGMSSAHDDHPKTSKSTKRFPKDFRSTPLPLSLQLQLQKPISMRQHGRFNGRSGWRSHRKNSWDRQCKQLKSGMTSATRPQNATNDHKCTVNTCGLCYMCPTHFWQCTCSDQSNTRGEFGFLHDAAWLCNSILIMTHEIISSLDITNQTGNMNQHFTMAMNTLWIIHLFFLHASGQPNGLPGPVRRLHVGPGSASKLEILLGRPW